MGFQIAIDGPAGAGKSTIAKMVAKKNGYIYVDTGALYRGLAFHFLQEGVAESEADMIESCKQVKIEMGYQNGEQQVFLNGKNITAFLRKEEVGELASKSSVLKEVREKLLEIQREIAREHDVVMDGRDIGTCVLPRADVKIFLTANVETRAQRRHKENLEKGMISDLEEIKKGIIERDERDSKREIAPLKQAEDAIYLDSSSLTISEVVEKIQKTILERRS